ncbi:hypothetical protein [Sulfuriroseicoccus oceanibius]|uniref:Uncharacterized protein n=1 Tax=Sulfuriroseicoccus oceanibius TaxID=2707525 RepID=A0A6B3L2J5_9BACT|nr:hypothetical protein [Sulfuriroseicoccus oceanibius]QQL44381.1 hypothetical protein G3M56_010865 [Sulfuriroseicoccus oceanibius]
MMTSIKAWSGVVRTGSACAALWLAAGASGLADEAASDVRIEVADGVAADQTMTVSSSGQFIVHGDDGPRRAEVAAFAEDVREDFLRLIGQKGSKWGLRIVVRSLPADGSDGGAVLRVEVVDGHSYLLTVFTKPGKAYSERRLRDVLVQSLILEQGLRRARPDEVHEGDVLPEWLWRGVVEAMAFRADRQRTELFKAMMQGETLMSVEQLLEKDPSELTQVGQRIYDASTGALVLTLLNQINGTTRFAQMLRDLPFAELSAMEMIERHFQNLAMGPSNLEKWWALEVAGMASPDAMDHVSPEESTRRIRSALRLVYVVEGENGNETRDVPLQEIGVIEEDQARLTALNSMRTRLISLQADIHPAYRSLVRELIDRVTGLMERKIRSKEQAKRVAEIVALERSGELLAKRLASIADVLNWMEVVTPGSTSGDPFKPFFDVLDELRAPSSERDDRISGYLDVIEGEFAR